MAALNTQLGYHAPRKPKTSQYAMPQAPRTSGVSRALAGIHAAPAAPSYSSPYADPTQSLFPQGQLPTVASQAPAGTPSTYTQGHPQAPAAPAGYTFNLETDPILQQMHAMAAKQRTDAEAGALAQRKQLAIQYGDQGYGNSIDANTGQAAAENPFSVTKNLAHDYETGTHNLDEQLNQHNLFYSGARINELANALRDYQGQQAQAAGSFQGALGNVDQNRIAALLGADSSEQGAYNDAYSRALAAALSAGATAPAGSSAGPMSLYTPPAGSSVQNPDQYVNQAPAGTIDPGFNITPPAPTPGGGTGWTVPGPVEQPPPGATFGNGNSLETGWGGGQRSLSSSHPQTQDPTVMLLRLLTGMQ